jgi:hypothetical protein
MRTGSWSQYGASELMFGSGVRLAVVGERRAQPHLEVGVLLTQRGVVPQSVAKHEVGASGFFVARGGVFCDAAGR